MRMFDEPKPAAVKVPKAAMEKPDTALSAPEVNITHSLWHLTSQLQSITHARFLALRVAELKLYMSRPNDCVCWAVFDCTITIFIAKVAQDIPAPPLNPTDVLAGIWTGGKQTRSGMLPTCKSYVSVAMNMTPLHPSRSPSCAPNICRQK